MSDSANGIGGHVVLEMADSTPYASVRGRPIPREQRRALGKALRREAPRSSLADWSPPPDRRDPVDLIDENHKGRIDWLVPVRVGRMTASPYGFLRGTAIVMAHDFAHLPATGITPVIGGGAPLGHFGFFASPAQQLVLGLNDFDEAHPRGWGWDLRRLVASLPGAGRGDATAPGAVSRDRPAPVRCRRKPGAARRRRRPGGCGRARRVPTGSAGDAPGR